jgi:hypothetical protein
MGLLFQLGLMLGTVIMIKFNLIIGVALMFIGNKIGGLGVVLEAIGLGYLVIFVISHTRCSYVVFSEMHDPNLLGKPITEPENVKEAVSIKKNQLLLGFIWRLSREIDFIKKTFKLDFKSTN